MCSCIAPGYAYGLKLSDSKTCVCVYFGDGAAQEGDAHAAMNFAVTLGCPVIFFWYVTDNDILFVCRPVRLDFALCTLHS